MAKRSDGCAKDAGIGKLLAKTRLLDHRLGEMLPEYATAQSAGLDLRACSFDGKQMLDRATVPPGGWFQIGTGLAIHIGSCGQMLAGLVLPRSSWGKKGLTLRNTIGLIDPDYQGEITLMCRNAASQAFVIEPMERIAQILFVPVVQVALLPVAEFEATDRGDGGFGSTGK